MYLFFIYFAIFLILVYYIHSLLLFMMAMIIVNTASFAQSMAIRMKWRITALYISYCFCLRSQPAQFYWWAERFFPAISEEKKKEISSQNYFWEFCKYFWFFFCDICHFLVNPICYHIFGVEPRWRHKST